MRCDEFHTCLMLKVAQNVVGFQIPVCYPMIVKKGQRICHLPDNTAGLSLSELLPPLNVAKQSSLPERTDDWQDREDVKSCSHSYLLTSCLLPGRICIIQVNYS